MAAITRASSFLPTIKCSRCSVEIPISQMGDHVCSQVPLLPDSRSRALDGPFATSTRPPMGPAPSSLRSGKTPSVRSNTSDTIMSVKSTSGSALKNSVPADEMPPPPQVPFSTKSTSSSSGRVSPVPSLSGRKSPHSRFLRSATAPLALQSSSYYGMPLPQDSAFPVFPTAKSRSTTPTTPQKATFTFPSEVKEAAGTHDAYPPSISRGNQGKESSEKMSSILPGPFNSRGMEVRRPLGADDTPVVNGGLGLLRSTSTSTTRSRARAPSTSSSTYTRNPSISSIGTFTRPNNDETDVPAVPTVPSVVLDYHAPPTQSHGEPTTMCTLDASPFNFGSFDQTAHSHTVLESGNREGSARTLSESTKSNPGEERPMAPRLSSDSLVQTHKSKPSVMLPLCEIGSASSFRPSKSLRGRRTEPPAVAQPGVELSRKADFRDEEKLGEVPPLPPSNASYNDSSNPYHTPHESVSSNESYGSGIKSSSSRSSPPLNSPLHNSPQRSKGQLGTDRFNDTFQGFQFGVENLSQPERSTADDNNIRPMSPPSQYAPLDLQKPSIPALQSPPRSVRPMKSAPAPLRDVQSRQNISPTTSPEDYLASPVSPFIDHARNIRLSPGIPPPPPMPESPARKRTPTSKGQCRGCNEAIYGKSISSADGQLSGRYHRQCFSCKTCHAPFQTTDFYVHNNNPYCARHYHEQNGSLCTNCDKGIEGLYLETDPRQKFHPFCFTCQQCLRILRDDFYEWNGQILCEQHAFGDAQRAAQQPSSLGPGRRFPERRTTRLMMM